MIEWIQGEGGIFPMTTEYARKARELADRYNALLVFDEIQCGVGRTGKYFAYQLADPVVLPDIMVAAKPLACGIPLGVIVANERAAQAIGPAMHGSTFGGGPLACRVALEFLDILEGLLPQIERTGSYFRMKLDELQRQFTFIREVRGRGLMIGVELDIPGKQIVLDAMAGRPADQLHARHRAALPAALHRHRKRDRPRGANPEKGAESRRQARRGQLSLEEWNQRYRAGEQVFDATLGAGARSSLEVCHRRMRSTSRAVPDVTRSISPSTAGG